MTERLARRLFMLAPSRYLNGGTRSFTTRWELLRDADRDNYLAAATRLIEEMRVPSPAMVRAGSPEDQSSVILWQTMIDAALGKDG